MENGYQYHSFDVKDKDEITVYLRPGEKSSAYMYISSDSIDMNYLPIKIIYGSVVDQASSSPMFSNEPIDEFNLNVR
jgi:hypothetical protein